MRLGRLISGASAGTFASKASVIFCHSGMKCYLYKTESYLYMNQFVVGSHVLCSDVPNVHIIIIYYRLRLNQ